MQTIGLSRDSHALVLLCSYLALPKLVDASTKPLSVGEWSHLAKRIHASYWRVPGALFGRSAAEVWETLGVEQHLAERVVGLLAREGQLAIELERLQARGIRVLTRADEAYPARLKRRLAGHAPVVLCYAGPVDLLSTEGVALVGSRDVDEEGQHFAMELGRRSAGAHLTVYSGGARGVDRLAMSGALSRGGTAAGILADSLERALRDPEIRRFVSEEALALATPFHPAVGFSVANAMARNKLVYCLADYAVVVSSSREGGGTRAGALENLKARWVPLFVRADASATGGNQELVTRGGVPLTLEELPEGARLREWFEAHASRAVPAVADVEQGLPLAVSDVSRGSFEAQPSSATSSPLPGAPAADSGDLFDVIWPRLDKYLQQWRTAAEIASFHCLEQGQAKAWLARAVAEGLAEQRKRPVSFRALRSGHTVVQRAMLLEDSGVGSNGH
jgi:predicted Rossmann fold nucleotide-binding protein DprA/Smf involved in DNA uptake